MGRRILQTFEGTVREHFAICDFSSVRFLKAAQSLTVLSKDTIIFVKFSLKHVF